MQILVARRCANIMCKCTVTTIQPLCVCIAWLITSYSDDWLHNKSTKFTLLVFQWVTIYPPNRCVFIIFSWGIDRRSFKARYMITVHYISRLIIKYDKHMISDEFFHAPTTPNLSYASTRILVHAHTKFLSLSLSLNRMTDCNTKKKYYIEVELSFTLSNFCNQS